MSQITITDLSFCENRGTNTPEINGGYDFPRLSTSFSANFSSSFNAFVSIYQFSDGGGSIYLNSDGAAAGAAAGAVSDGSTYTYAYASTYTA
ncbi:hypothetical protein [Planktothrix sp. FACHB-1365]|uniref:hypothetical protein n=1 Tax=Planktothrix sp. FACHB-1365 TaxID=2692855 RepID=UPI0016828A83|nr:hypothetical protein [Planktothrix sp. FACHB-1365]MBD2483510.1 hypothetical protein [Planktothrix sp. FACHB-1365]